MSQPNLTTGTLEYLTWKINWRTLRNSVQQFQPVPVVCAEFIDVAHAIPVYIDSSKPTRVGVLLEGTTLHLEDKFVLAVYHHEEQLEFVNGLHAIIPSVSPEDTPQARERFYELVVDDLEPFSPYFLNSPLTE